MNPDSKIYVAGHGGLVGGSLCRNLKEQGFQNVVTRTHAELELVSQAQVEAFFEAERPDYVFLAAALVGGIHANATYPADFIYNNIMIQSNVIAAAHKHGVKKLLAFGSACAYPKLAEQPMKVDTILTGAIEPTNEAYALAKLSGITMCKSYRTQHGSDFFTVIPATVYGPGDNIHPENSHVIPGLMRRMHEAKGKAPEVVVWGTGSPLREFIYTDDLSRACIFLMNEYAGAGPVNIGTGQEISIKDLALAIQKVVDYEGTIKFDTDRPDGAPRKVLDSSELLGMGWKPGTGLEAGLAAAYEDFLARVGQEKQSA